MSSRQIQLWAHPGRILLATDLTDLKLTLPLAIHRARLFRAELRIAHVLPDPSAPPTGPAQTAQNLHERTIENAEAALAKAVAKAKASGVRCSSHLVAGDPVQEITKIAALWKTDRLIASSRGKGKLHRNILGSVAASLFHHMEIPVLAVGPNAKPERNYTRSHMRIVFAASLDHDSRRLAEFALAVAENQSADIALLHVAAEAVLEHPTTVRVTEYAKRMLQDLLTLRPIKKSRPTCELVRGQPVKEILEFARQYAADMIILGASAHSAFNTSFIPGTAYRVLCESPCPVLVLKQASAWSDPSKDTASTSIVHPA